MKKQQVREAVIHCLHSLVAQSGQKNQRITDATRPIPDMGLHSEDGADFACDLSSRGFEIPDDINPLVNDEGTRPRTVGEIVDLIIELNKRPTGADNG